MTGDDCLAKARSNEVLNAEGHDCHSKQMPALFNDGFHLGAHNYGVALLSSTTNSPIAKQQQKFFW